MEYAVFILLMEMDLIIPSLPFRVAASVNLNLKSG
jgi:hypothetical protein